MNTTPRAQLSEGQTRLRHHVERLWAEHKPAIIAVGQRAGKTTLLREMMLDEETGHDDVLIIGTTMQMLENLVGGTGVRAGRRMIAHRNVVDVLHDWRRDFAEPHVPPLGIKKTTLVVMDDLMDDVPMARRLATWSDRVVCLGSPYGANADRVIADDAIPKYPTWEIAPEYLDMIRQQYVQDEAHARRDFGCGRDCP